MHDVLATVLFGIAVVQTFSASYFLRLAERARIGSFKHRALLVLGEVETAFGLWAIVFVLLTSGKALEGVSFREPLFVLAIIPIAASRPIVWAARKIVLAFSKLIPLPREASVYFSCLFLGPILGSFITEPAAMAVTALLLRDRYLVHTVSERFKYLTLAVLLVNVSIGGVLTPYAAPPVLMVAGKWGWDLGYMFATFGEKALIATAFNAFIAVFVLRKEISGIRALPEPFGKRMPFLLTYSHMLLLAGVVIFSHVPAIFLAIFGLFIAWTRTTARHQDRLKLKEAGLVAFFLAGLVILGGPQKWWLGPIISGLSHAALYIGAAFLTTFTDNAALTYLGSQISGITESMKQALLAGAVVGGGMTVIANAPNPAGFAILEDRFGKNGILSGKLALYAAVPTLVALIVFWKYS